MNDTNQTMTETRQGFIFTCKSYGREVATGEEDVELFLEGRETPICRVTVDDFDVKSSSKEGLLDAAFQKWIAGGVFVGKDIADPTLYSMLLVAHREVGVGWRGYDKAFRFLRAAGGTPGQPRMILTVDKSDLPEDHKRKLMRLDEDPCAVLRVS